MTEILTDTIRLEMEPYSGSFSDFQLEIPDKLLALCLFIIILSLLMMLKERFIDVE